MNINRYNIKYTIVKNIQFNIDNVKCFINEKSIQHYFITINYKTNYLNIDGIYLKTPKISLLTKCILLNNYKHKYLFEIPLVDNYNFNNIFSNIDKKINTIINNYNTTTNNINNTILLYDKTVKENTIIIDSNVYEYKFIRAKLNTNECNIILDNKIYCGNIEDLDYSKLQMEIILSCHGLCKINNKYVLSWKILKLEMNTINNQINLNNYKNILFKKISKKINKKEEDFVNNSINNNIEFDEEHIYIPNFELELDNIDI